MSTVYAMSTVSTVYSTVLPPSDAFFLIYWAIHLLTLFPQLLSPCCLSKVFYLEALSRWLPELLSSSLLVDSSKWWRNGKPKAHAAKNHKLTLCECVGDFGGLFKLAFGNHAHLTKSSWTLSVRLVLYPFIEKSVFNNKTSKVKKVQTSVEASVII